MDTPQLEDIVSKLKEYGQIYSNIKSEDIKEQLLHSAPDDVLDAFSLATKNVLIGNICVTKNELDNLRPYRKSLEKLGFNKCSSKVKRRLLSEGDIFSSLSYIMSKLTTPTLD